MAALIKGFAETDDAGLLEAHQQLGGPIVLTWDNWNTHVSRTMRQLVAARLWLTVYQLPPYARASPPDRWRSGLDHVRSRAAEAA